MSKRNDLHNAVNLVTENYEYMFAADLQAQWARGLASTDSGREFLRELANLDPATADRGYNQCHHCGSHIRYAAWLKHLPTGYTIVVGETCLENRFDRATADFQKLRKQAELDRKQMRIKTAVAKFVSDNPDLAFMADKDHEHTNGFVADVSRKLRMYGELSERQIEAVRRSVQRDAEYAAKKAAEAANPEVLVPVVEGKGTLVGEVLSVKWYDSDFGGSLKMRVKDDRGFTVFGTVPASLPNLEKGDRVAFSATVTAKDGEVGFGYFKRPTKGVNLTEKEEAA